MDEVILLVWLSGISEPVTAVSIILGAIALFTSLACAATYFLDDKDGVRYVVAMVVCTFLALLLIGLGVVFPSKKSLELMAGIKGVDVLSKTETAKNINDVGNNMIKDLGVILHNYATQTEKK